MTMLVMYDDVYEDISHMVILTTTDNENDDS